MKNRYIFFLIMFYITFSDMRAGNSIKTTDDIPVKNPNPAITEILSAINKDSLALVMQSLVNMGTRFMYSENRKQVAMWIAAKFMSYGYTDLALDSFKVTGETVPEDSVWQYNVVATFPGNPKGSNPVVFIISICRPIFVPRVFISWRSGWVQS